ncbi:NLGN2 [Anthophora quadrimaculata]
MPYVRNTSNIRIESNRQKFQFYTVTVARVRRCSWNGELIVPRRFCFQKMGSVHGEDLPFVFGAPLVDGFGHFPRNYTRPEVALSESIVQYFANFVRTG